MIYFFYGDDFRKVRSKLKAFIKAVQAKKPEISLVEVNEENQSEHSLLNLIGGQGLFEKELLIILDNLMSQDIKEEILENIKELKESKNVFVIVETGFKPDKVSVIEKNAEKTEKFVLEKQKAEEFNNFALADALGRRDKRKLWSLYYKAVSSGSVPEEIHGILFWQIKSIILAKELDLKESEMKPFVYNKAKGFSKNFSDEELKNFSNRLVDIYHQARTTGSDLNLELEKFVLKV